MSSLDERVKQLVQETNCKKKKKIVRTLSKADKNSVNRSIAQKTKQNKTERELSKEVAYNDDKIWK